MQQYLNLLDHVLKNGVKKEDRTGGHFETVKGAQALPETEREKKKKTKDF